MVSQKSKDLSPQNPAYSDSNSSNSEDDDVFDPEEQKAFDRQALKTRQARRSFIVPNKKLSIPEPAYPSPPEPISSKGINVFVRFRPDNQQEHMYGGQESVLIDPSEKHVTLNVDGLGHPFSFRRVFGGGASQEQLFVSCGLPLLEKMLDGYNCAIIAYGQTGGGKTYTLLGPGYDNPQNIGKGVPETLGIIPRMIENMFARVYSNYDYSIDFSIYASYIQIYMEQVFDLLSPGERKKLRIREEKNQGLAITSALNIPVKNKKEVFKLMEQGTRNRVTAETNSNAVSSRSHAMLVLTIQKNFRDQGNFLQSQVYLVDLCGSERVSKTKAVEERLDEAKSINKSLLQLGNVIAALVQQKKHIPYRNSILTRLLSNCFGGNSLTSLILCCSANSYNAPESLSTLRFGDRANLIHNNPVKNQMQTVDALKRLLVEANTKITVNDRTIRSLQDRVIELEQMIFDLHMAVGQNTKRIVNQKYQKRIPIPKKQCTFTNLSISILTHIFSFIQPQATLRYITLCKIMNRALKNQALWQFYLKQAVKGQYTLSGNTDPSRKKWEFKGVELNRVSNYFEVYCRVMKQKTEAMKNAPISHEQPRQRPVSSRAVKHTQQLSGQQSVKEISLEQKPKIRFVSRNVRPSSARTRKNQQYNNQ